MTLFKLDVSVHNGRHCVYGACLRSHEATLKLALTTEQPLGVLQRTSNFDLPGGLSENLEMNLETTLEMKFE